MKFSRDQSTRQNKQMITHKPKPEIRDDLDSRKNEEQGKKGGDITHNRKDHRNNKPANKK